MKHVGCVKAFEHLFLLCPFASAIWWVSELNLRTEQVQQSSLQHRLERHIIEPPSRRSTRIIIIILWAIWQQQRNIQIHEYKDVSALSTSLTI